MADENMGNGESDECAVSVDSRWKKWTGTNGVGARCLVEPTRLRRVLALRVEIRANKNPLARYCGDPSRVEGSECGQKGRRGRECCTVPNVEKQRGGPDEMTGKLKQFDMHIVMSSGRTHSRVCRREGNEGLLGRGQ